jgi:hypothetical protein
MVTCALCGCEYDPTALSCQGRCPLAGPNGCGLICCPRCGYQTVDERRSAVARLLARLRPGSPEPRAPQKVVDP